MIFENFQLYLNGNYNSIEKSKLIYTVAFLLEDFLMPEYSNYMYKLNKDNILELDLIRINNLSPNSFLFQILSQSDSYKCVN